MKSLIRLVLFAISILCSKWANALVFSVDPASPSIDGNITPDDVLESGPTVFTQGSSLGLQDNFFTGDFDNLDAISYGQDPIQNPIYFSVDRVTVGLPPSDVYSQAQSGVEEAQGDVYQTLPPFNSNSLSIDEEQLGLIPGFFGDDLDGLELDSYPNPYTYFSIDILSSTNIFGAGDFAGSILVSDGSGTFGTYAHYSLMGLQALDDLDGLVLFDIGDGNLDTLANPIIDKALFSLSPFSPSTYTHTGLDYIPCVIGHMSPADICYTDFTNSFSIWASAEAIGLRSDDNVDALDTIPEPDSLLLLSIGLVGMLANRKIRHRITFSR